MTTDKIICDCCGWHGMTSELLRAPDPFETEHGSELSGCPNCKSVLNGERGIMACCEEGCWGEASAGVPTDDGYKNWCSKHYQKHRESCRD